jgi:hypothetical protein
MADTAAVAFLATDHYGDPSNQGPADATEVTAVSFNVVLVNDDAEPNVAGPHGVWGVVKG